MYKNKKILGVITARGGSRGIPGKNIKILAGEPLIAYTIKAAKGSRYLDYFLVSTDDKDIAHISKKRGAPTPFLRPRRLATDKARSIPVLIHALNWLEKHKKERYNYVMILQPTSPFRTSKDIDECIKKIIDSGADSVMSMVKLTDFSLPKIKKVEAGLISAWMKNEGKFSALKSEQPEVYKRNCAIYVTKTDLIMKGDLFGKVSAPYVMPPERSIDINTPFDFLIADLLMKEVKKRKPKL